MLSADMKKEDLCGRTLTLKLKTASFEVRTRAVTVQKYICSSEDILKHASKLLKAELPISLRLIGLRMSQFNEDKEGIPSDPTQKTLSNFLISGDATGRNLDDHITFGSDLNEDHYMTEQKTGPPIDNHEICCNSFGEQLDNFEIPDPNSGKCILSLGNHKMEKSDGSLNNISKVEDNTFKEIGHTLKHCEGEASQLVNIHSFSLSGQFEGSCLDTVNKRTNLSVDEAASSSNQKEQYLWVDDYKCLLCGIELPPSFVEERQEHSDFHLAERLQKEESDSYPRNLALKQRFIQKDHITSPSRRKKKHKSSPTDGKHLPIDTFFVKSNENF